MSHSPLEFPLMRWARKACRRLPALLLVPSLVFGLTRCSDLPVEPAPPQAAPASAPLLLLQPDGLLCTGEGATLSSGALYRVCMSPGNWNRDIVAFVPGYHDPANGPGLPDDISETPASLLFTGLGYAFASTSFRDTGLLEPDTWIAQDLLELVATAKAVLEGATNKTTRYVYQTGGSQGGLVTVKAVEQFSSVFHGGLAGCGPIGDYRRQIDHVGDFRVVFDYFFHEVVTSPGDPAWVYPIWTQNLAAGDPGFVDPGAWEAVKANAELAVDDPANASRLDQVLSVTGAPIDPNQPASKKATAGAILWYSFRGTNDAIAKLNGMPFANQGRTYSGSADDAALNANVQRFGFTADPGRLYELQTSARPGRPIVTIQTTDDPVVPAWHQSLYRSRLSWLRRWLHTPFTIQRYGHCNFTDAEILAAFAVLVLKVSGQNLLLAGSMLPEAESRQSFLDLAARHGARPQIGVAPHHSGQPPSGMPGKIRSALP